MPAAKHHSLHPPITEYLKSIPGVVGIRLDEEPNYRVRDEIDDFEIRDYPQTLAAKFAFMGIFSDFKKVAFHHLADYIFSNSIEMTIPVTLSNRQNIWTMSFLLPKRFKIRNAPPPENKSIVLENVPPRTIIAHKFTGNCPLEKMREEGEKIEARFKKHSKYTAVEAPLWAIYDAPLTVPFLKRNEVWLPVRVQGA